jgi:hypothetical protein
LEKIIAILLTAAALLLARPAVAQTDTSYLLIQGPFGSGGSTETFLWQINYQNGVLLTGQDLLTAVLGSTSLDGTYTDGFGSTYNYYTSGNSTQGAGFIDFGYNPTQLTEPFLVSITLGSTTVAQATDYSTGWNYYVAGGSGAEGPNDDGDGTPYPGGTWTVSNDGAISRTLSNGSFDAYLYGDTTYGDPVPPIVGGTDAYAPTTSNFAGATVVPEPDSTALLLLGAGGILVFLKKQRA